MGQCARPGNHKFAALRFHYWKMLALAAHRLVGRPVTGAKIACQELSSISKAIWRVLTEIGIGARASPVWSILKTIPRGRAPLHSLLPGRVLQARIAPAIFASPSAICASVRCV